MKTNKEAATCLIMLIENHFKASPDSVSFNLEKFLHFGKIFNCIMLARNGMEVETSNND